MHAVLGGERRNHVAVSSNINEPKSAIDYRADRFVFSWPKMRSVMSMGSVGGRLMSDGLMRGDSVVEFDGFISFRSLKCEHFSAV